LSKGQLEAHCRSFSLRTETRPKRNDVRDEDRRVDGNFRWLVAARPELEVWAQYFKAYIESLTTVRLLNFIGRLNTLGDYLCSLDTPPRNPWDVVRSKHIYDASRQNQNTLSQDSNTSEPFALNATANEPDGVEIEIEADSTLGYASIQNSVPVIRSLRLTNHGTETLENLEVLVTCNPRFAESIKLRFDRLSPSETRRVSPVDLHPDHSYLAELQEAVQAVVKVSVLAGANELAHKAQSMEVLAYDQWAGTRALPELLAAFCMPNNPAVDILIGKASKLLRSQYSELSMNGQARMPWPVRNHVCVTKAC
jgi:hypothetical protein